MSRRPGASPESPKPLASSVRVFTGPYRFAATQGCPRWLRSPKPSVCDSPSKQLDIFASVSNHFESLFNPSLPEQTGDATSRNALVLFASPLLSVLVGLPADACVYFVRWSRKSGAGPQQSRAREHRASFGIDLSLDAYDGTAASLETPNRNHDLISQLGCAAIRGGDKGHAAGNLKYGLRAIETMRGTIVNVQSVGELPARDYRVAGRKTNAQVLGKVRLGHHELVEKRGRAGCGYGDNIASCRID